MKIVKQTQQQVKGVVAVETCCSHTLLRVHCRGRRVKKKTETGENVLILFNSAYILAQCSVPDVWFRLCLRFCCFKLILWEKMVLNISDKHEVWRFKIL